MTVTAPFAKVFSRNLERGDVFPVDSDGFAWKQGISIITLKAQGWD
jgi:hypothetical protein